ncbi:hypothetical protein [Candidatus Odyssella acanthamoebae]|uniref:Uncharacterized protein n=1 Tax=Candidatus Odyssella acanthamoebae TaxID=91604 RepID=A0A077ASH0_9PROT|nr:hypothetical protein [Candidatus Paracaedibacter acanthamoebae]AIK96147.1 hypothetical protein ID47_04405 [Candidatus Paracaedibacter acanthamoebae]
MSLMTLSEITFAADDLFPIAPTSPAQAISHLSVRGALEEHNQIRFNRSEAFEEAVGRQKFAADLPENLKQILKTHTKSNEFSKTEVVQALFKLIDPNMEVKQVEKLEGGFVSGQIYRVQSRDVKSKQTKVFYIKYLRTKPILVSKGRTYGEEANLRYLAQASHLKYMRQHIDIILPTASYEYQVKDERKIFMILPSAEGESLSKLVQSNNLDAINQVFAALGSALGKVHLHYQFFPGVNGSKTPKIKQDFINVSVPSHGDLHGDNVFYNDSTQRIAFIDVETMANSFDEKDQANSPLCYDMLYMMLMSPKKFGEFMPKNNWVPFLNMFKSYVEVYPVEQRQGLYDYLIYCLQRVDKIEFVDIFKYFNFTKKFGRTEVKEAKILAQNLHSSKIEFVKQLNVGRDWKKECTETIENIYLNKEPSATSKASSPPSNRPSPNAKLSPARSRAFTAPVSSSTNSSSPKVPAKLPLPVTPTVVGATHKVVPLPVKSKEVGAINKLTLSPVVSKITVETHNVIPLPVKPKGVGATNKVTPLSVTPKVVSEMNKVVALNNTSLTSTTPQRQDIRDLRKRFESLPNPGGGKVLSTKKN